MSIKEFITRVLPSGRLVKDNVVPKRKEDPGNDRDWETNRRA